MPDLKGIRKRRLFLTDEPDPVCGYPKNAAFYARYFIMFVKISNVLRAIYLRRSPMWN